MTTTTLNYTIEKPTPHTGAEVRGVDLREPVDTATRIRLNRAFVDHSVLVFREQHLSPAQLHAAVLTRVPLCIEFLKSALRMPGARSLGGDTRKGGRLTRQVSWGTLLRSKRYPAEAGQGQGLERVGADEP